MSIPSSFAGRYVLGAEIGRGGMAVVYRARDQRHDREVAVKVLHQDVAASLGTDRFLREIQTAARLNHPHIIPLHDSGESEGLLYYVMPLIEGHTLRQRLQVEKRLPVSQAVGIGRQVAAALDYAHRLGIVHRDVKPENVMLYEGEALVMDFGIAKALIAAGGDTLTRTGSTLGTPAYMSPEQAAGGDDVDSRSDQYSLACMIYEMLAGVPPFSGGSPQAIIAKRFAEVPKPVGTLAKEVPAVLERAVSRALSREPANRFSTTLEFSVALEAGAVVGREQESSDTRQSIAVLPFTNMSADPENEYFSDGIAEEIINSLTKVQALDVVSRTSAFAFRSTNEDIREIGRKLEVRTVLEGSVRKAASRLRVTAQLIDVHTGYHLWSERYDRQIADIFEIQDEIADNIVKALRVVLTAREHMALKKSATRDVRAYEYYLRGRQLFHQHRRETHERARELYRRAIEIDPNYALAYAGIADSASFQYMYIGGEDRDLEEADTASRRALELDPSLAEGHASRGLALALTRKYQEAESELAEAMRLDPTLFEAPYFYARTALAQANYPLAAEMYERAAALRPDDYQPVALLVSVLEKLDRPEAARDAELRALALIERAVEINPGDQRALYFGVGALARLGEWKRAEEWTTRVLALGPEEPATLYNLGCTQAVMGHTEKALELLERAIARGFSHSDWLRNDPDWRSLSGHPRFEELAASIVKSQ